MMRQEISIWDKFVSITSYFTFGMTGLIWLIAAFLIFKKQVTPFCAYHIYQSIFISVFLYVISMAFSIAYSFVAAIPYLGSFLKMIYVYLNTPLFFTLSLINFIIFLILVYLSLGALLGKLSYFLFISDVIRANFRR